MRSYDTEHRSSESYEAFDWKLCENKVEYKVVSEQNKIEQGRIVQDRTNRAEVKIEKTME